MVAGRRGCAVAKHRSAHMCRRWTARGMQCPFAPFEKAREKKKEKEEKGEGEANAQIAETAGKRQWPFWLAIPLAEGVRLALQKEGSVYDVLAAAEDIAATEARKIPVSATKSLFDALRPGMEVMPGAAAVGAAAVTAIAVKRFGGGRFFQSTRFREALATGP